MGKTWIALIATTLLFIAPACTGSSPGSPHGEGNANIGSGVPDGVIVHGGGASSPDALYQVVNARFNASAGREAVTYSKSGSVDGRMQLAVGTLDMAGSDSLPSEEEELPADVLYFPVAATPIVVAFNLPGIDRLSFSPTTLASMFQGDLERWDAHPIRVDNPGTDLPADPIEVVHRSDGSGTTLNFTRFLDSAAPGTWRLGSGDEIAWPRGTIGGEKNSGVAELITTTRGSIGYVDLADAAKAGLDLAKIGNASGEFVAPTAVATAAALASVRPTERLTFDLADLDAPGAYPITAPTWLLVSTNQDPDRAELLRSYLRYLLGPGQDLALEVGFVPLPAELASSAIAQIDRIGS